MLPRLWALFLLGVHMAQREKICLIAVKDRGKLVTERIRIAMSRHSGQVAEFLPDAICLNR